MRKPIVFNGVPLEDVCPDCKGTPPRTSYLLGLVNDAWCNKCANLGVVLNEQGRGICQLVLNHITGNETNIRFK